MDAFIRSKLEWGARGEFSAMITPGECAQVLNRLDAGDAAIEALRQVALGTVSFEYMAEMAEGLLEQHGIQVNGVHPEQQKFA